VVTYPYSPALDPIAHGVRVIIQNAAGGTVLDGTVPGGLYDQSTQRGWRTNTDGSAFIYRHIGNIVPKIEGIKRVVIFDRSSRDPGRLKFSVQGREGNYPLTPAEGPIRAVIVFDVPAATTGQCAEADYPGPPPTPTCTFSSDGSFAVCHDRPR